MLRDTIVDFKISNINKSVENLTGVSAEELVGQRLAARQLMIVLRKKC
jgi:hypothetical protein